MKTKFEQFIESAKAVRLTAIEKRDLRRKLLAYCQMHPIKAKTEASYHLPLIERDLRGQQLSTWSLFSFRIMAPAIAILLVVGGGVSFGAEGALPGDRLYPVKVVINEGLVAKLAPTKASKVNWETARAERRLLEAEQLAVAGKLDSTTEAEVTTHLESHLSKAAKEIKGIAAEGKNIVVANELSTKLESKLRIHTQILSGLEAGQGGGVSMAGTVAAQAETVAEVREESKQKNLADGTKTKQAVIDQKASAAKSKKDLQDLLAQNNTVDLDIKDAVTTQLERITEVEKLGQAKLDGGEYDLALLEFEKVGRLAEEAKVLFGVKKNLDISISVIPTPDLGSEAATTSAATSPVSSGATSIATSTSLGSKATIQVNLGQ